ncbi:hypothetical protein MMSP_2726 [Mycobacterium sp. 012931]|nr:hypothetical protein MMSP_2726 [Mycobacterium sp. 012931]
MAACRPKTAKLAANPQLHDYVQQRLSGRSGIKPASNQTRAKNPG